MPGRVAREDVDVGGDRVGRRALRDRRLGHRVVEAAAAVADVEDDAALLGRSAAGSSLPSCTMLVNWPALFGAPE